MPKSEVPHRVTSEQFARIIRNKKEHPNCDSCAVDERTRLSASQSDLQIPLLSTTHAVLHLCVTKGVLNFNLLQADTATETSVGTWLVSSVAKFHSAFLKCIFLAA